MTTLLNPCDLTIGETVQSYYSGILYLVGETKQGVSKMKNIRTNEICYFNACNNRHFIREMQLKLF